MGFGYPAFGRIIVDGVEYGYDVVIEDGIVRPRDKSPSRVRRAAHGHTPLTAAEAIPWSKPKLVIGSGYSGRLPVLPEVADSADGHRVELVVMPTSEAVDLLNRSDPALVNAILHVTC